MSFYNTPNRAIRYHLEFVTFCKEGISSESARHLFWKKKHPLYVFEISSEFLGDYFLVSHTIM